MEKKTENSIGASKSPCFTPVSTLIRSFHDEMEVSVNVGGTLTYIHTYKQGKCIYIACVCEVSAVGKISDCQPEGPGFNSLLGRGLNFGPTFLHHTVRGQGC